RTVPRQQGRTWSHLQMVKCGEDGVAARHRPENPAGHLDDPYSRISEGRVEGGTAVDDQKAFEAPVVGAAQGGVDGPFEAQATDEQMVDARTGQVFRQRAGAEAVHPV